MRFQQLAAVVMLVGVLGISGLLVWDAYLSPDLPQSPSTARSSLAEPAPPWIGTVTAVIDGDTIEVDRDGRACRVRIYGIDCPENGQPFADEAREFTASLVAGRQVRMTPVELDRLGRTVADVTLSDGDTAHHLNRELLEAGLAWWYQEECPQARDLESLEGQARKARRGLWADPNSVPPWEYREMKRKAGAADTAADSAPTPPR
jgi:micrococcal nuclease